MSIRFVLDASVALAWCFSDEGDATTAQALHALYDGEAMVPPVWALEVSNVLVMAERHGRLSRSACDRFLHLLTKLPITIDTSCTISTSIMDFARSYRLSCYDASYLELAVRLGWPLATQDAALRLAASKAGVPVFGSDAQHIRESAAIYNP